ncbi:hypothetical protein [Paracoccus aminophilus]|nr:hypothetical protein [Paracoccus aminophilus]
MSCDDHVDATVFWIAVALVDRDGKAPDWVRRVVREKGWGDIDIDAARIWIDANPAGCACRLCRPTGPAQLSLF